MRSPPTTHSEVNRIAAGYIAWATLVTIGLLLYLLPISAPLVHSDLPWWALIPVVAALQFVGVSRAHGRSDSVVQDMAGLVQPLLLLTCAPWQGLLIVLADTFPPAASLTHP